MNEVLTHQPAGEQRGFLSTPRGKTSLHLLSHDPPDPTHVAPRSYYVRDHIDRDGASGGGGGGGSSSSHLFRGDAV